MSKAALGQRSGRSPREHAPILPSCSKFGALNYQQQLLKVFSTMAFANTVMFTEAPPVTTTWATEAAVTLKNSSRLRYFGNFQGS